MMDDLPLFSGKPEEIFKKATPKLGSLEYRTYLASSQWKEKRKAVITRCRGWCEQCLKAGLHNKMADVHHLTYERLGDERLTDLMAVCESCHRALDPIREKEMQRRNKEKLNEARKDGYKRAKFGEEHHHYEDLDPSIDDEAQDWVDRKDAEEFDD